jgi:AraC family transcriptional regulator
VRELKLSQAAEHLLDGKDRVIDIALGLGFNSEISFSRSFKQMFGSSPSQYRKAGKRVGLRKPIQVSETASTSEKGALSFVEVRIDERESFLVKGMTSEISGLFSLTQDFAQKVPQLWSRLEGEVEIPDDNVLQFIGVVDLTQSCFDGTNIHYWAGVELQEGISIPQLPSIISERLEVLTVPKQTYAVVKHCGPIENLRHTLSWFVLNWMPSSGYRGVDGYELEVYPFAYQAHASDAEMEYWVPIIKS